MMPNIVDEINYRLDLFYNGRYDKLFLGYENDFNSFCTAFYIMSKNLLAETERISLSALALQSNLNANYKVFVFNYLSNGDKLNLLERIIDDGKPVNLSFEYLDISGNQLEFIKEHVIDFIQIGFDVYHLREMFALDVNVIAKIDNYFKHNPLLVKNILSNYLSFDIFKVYGDLLFLIIMDIIKNEEACFSDISWIDEGEFSFVFIIKNKVLKIGTKRATDSFPNNPYIIKPLLRKSFDIEGLKLFVEVTERVETFDESAKKYDSQFGEELYQLYKKVRELGLVWTDVGTRNVGRLLKDNIIYWKGKLYPSDKVLGLEPYVGKNILLKAGELVILDADHIFAEKNIKESLLKVYDEDDFIIPVTDYDDDIIDKDDEPDYNYEAFEERYQRELRLKNG